MPDVPILIAGDDGVAVRVREELEGTGVTVVCVCTSADALATRAAHAAGTAVVVGRPGDEGTWRQAGLDGAAAVGLLGGDDLANLDAALLVAEATTRIPIVVRLFSGDLAHGVEHLLGGRGTVLSATEVAAPAFVQAVLSGNEGQRVPVAGHVLEVADVDSADPRLVVALAPSHTPTDVLPVDVGPAEHVLGLIDPQGAVAGVRGAVPAAVAAHQRARDASSVRPRRRRAPWRRRLRTQLGAVPRRVWLLLGVIATVLSLATTTFSLGLHESVVNALYFTVATMATVGYGDISLAHEAAWLKLFDVGLMASSALLLGSFLALVTDRLVSTRIDSALGRFPLPDEDHVIVCGLGKAGSRIIAALHELDVPCVGVEQHAQAAGVAVARGLRIPVVVADARTPGTLDQLRVGTARAVMAVTDDDLANLQAGLAARERNPGLRIVLRCFDPHLAERLDRSMELDLTRSVAGLAAPAFAAALLGHEVAEPLPLSNVPLRVLETTVAAASPYAGRLVRDLHHERELRVLALDGRWRPRTDLIVEAGMSIAVVGTREACDALSRAG